ncbi:MAG: ribosome small subunit-dependent GTPase A, partial [Aquabacterium sp.]
KPVELAGLMPDLAPHASNCRFSNCSHRQEPGCAVRQALKDGHISAGRMRVYDELFEELGQQRW